MLSTLPLNPSSVDSIRSLTGLGKSGNSSTKPLFTEVQQAAKMNPTNNVSDNKYRKDRLNAEGFSKSAHSHVTPLGKDRKMQANKASPNYLNPGVPHASLNKGVQNAWSRLVANRDNYEKKLGTAPHLYAHPDAKSLSLEFNSSRDNFGNATFEVCRDGHSSNIDLQLGQPSEVHASLSSLSTAMNPLEFGAACNHKKSQVKFPLMEKSKLLENVISIFRIFMGSYDKCNQATIFLCSLFSGGNQTTKYWSLLHFV